MVFNISGSSWGHLLEFGNLITAVFRAHIERRRNVAGTPTYVQSRFPLWEVILEITVKRR